MTIDFHSSLFGVCAVVFVIVWIVTRYGPIRNIFISSASIVGAIMLPAFVPRGGDVVMVVPGASLFSSHNEISWAIACFFMVINYLILSKLFSGISRKRAT